MAHKVNSLPHPRDMHMLWDELCEAKRVIIRLKGLVKSYKERHEESGLDCRCSDCLETKLILEELK